MGWSRGSELAEEMWVAVRSLIPSVLDRVQAARKIIGLFEDADCDTIDEAETLCADAGRNEDGVYTPVFNVSGARTGRFLHGDLDATQADDQQSMANQLARKADAKAVAEDVAYRKFLDKRRAALQIGDMIRVTINGQQYESTVLGFDQNVYGLPFVKFCIDWDEGPIDYNWNVSLVEKIER